MCQAMRLLGRLCCALWIGAVTASAARAQATAETVAAVSAALPRALDLARFQAPGIDTLVAFRAVAGERHFTGAQILAAAAPRAPVKVADSPPICPWSEGGTGHRGMGVHISEPEVSSRMVTFDLELLCSEGGSTFAWMFKFTMLQTQHGWIVRELQELSIT